MIREYYKTVDEMKELFRNTDKELLAVSASKYTYLNEDDVCDIQFVINEIISNNIDLAYNIYSRLDTLIRELIIEICEGSYR